MRRLAGRHDEDVEHHRHAGDHGLDALGLAPPESAREMKRSTELLCDLRPGGAAFAGAAEQEVEHGSSL